MPDATKDYSKLPATSPLGAPLDWAWLRGAKSEWGVRPKPSPRGLTMLDIAVGSYGEVPEHPTHRSMAPRGADIEAGSPDMGYILNDKADVWAENTRELYEEAVAAAVERDTRHPVGRATRARRRPRTRDVPALHAPHRG